MRTFPMIAFFFTVFAIAAAATYKGWLDSGPGDPEGMGLPVWGLVVCIGVAVFRRRQSHKEVQYPPLAHRGKD